MTPRQPLTGGPESLQSQSASSTGNFHSVDLSDGRTDGSSITTAANNEAIISDGDVAKAHANHADDDNMQERTVSLLRAGMIEQNNGSEMLAGWTDAIQSEGLIDDNDDGLLIAAAADNDVFISDETVARALAELDNEEKESRTVSLDRVGAIEEGSSSLLRKFVFFFAAAYLSVHVATDRLAGIGQVAFRASAAELGGSLHRHAD